MMKALVLEEIGKLEYTEVERPFPGRDEVLVRVMAAGICGSDIPRAYTEGAHNMPLIIGHEFSGTVESVGEGVSKELEGKRVGVFPLIPCKKCGPCLKGQYEMCRNYSYLGSRRNGGFAEYVTVPAWNLIELPDNVSFEAAAMLEPMAVAVHSMRRTLDGSGRDISVVVCGLGTIGLLLTAFILDAGYKNVFVIGNKDFQKRTAVKLGISEEHYCDACTEDALSFIMKKTEDNGADVFFECVGKNETASLAVSSASPGGSVCFVGNPHSDMTFEKNVYWKILRNQLTVRGTWNSSYGGMDNSEDDWHYVIDRLEKGGINAEDLITHRFPLSDIIKGFEIMHCKMEDYIKVMFTA